MGRRVSNPSRNCCVPVGSRALHQLSEGGSQQHWAQGGTGRRALRSCECAVLSAVLVLLVLRVPSEPSEVQVLRESGPRCSAGQEVAVLSSLDGL